MGAAFVVCYKLLMGLPVGPRLGVADTTGICRYWRPRQGEALHIKKQDKGRGE